MANEFVSFDKLKLFLENIKTKIISPLSIRISSLEKSHGGGGTSSSFKPRADENQDRPDIAKDKYWKCVGFGDGINTFPNIHEDYSSVPNGSALPNCTGYAQGRLYEIIDQTEAEEYVVFTRGNAEQIYDQYSENQRGQIPKLGAVMCWKNRGDEYGHVAIVEVMNKVGDHYQIIASESMYPRDESQIKDRWYMVRTYEYSNGGYYNSMVPSSVYEFQGFVYAITIPEAPIQDLATVAYTGEYSDLLNTPVIPDEQINSDWNATSGKAKILNKPTIPAAQVNSDWNATSGKAQILNKPAIPAAQIQSDWNQTDPTKKDFIKNKPIIPPSTTCVSNQGDMSSDKNTAFGKISCRKYSDGTCDFTIDFRVYACEDTSSNHILSQAKIAALIGATNVTFGASQIFCWKPDGSNIGSQSTNPTWGYTGLLSWSDSGGYTRIGRYNTTSSSGAWAMAQINSGLFYGKMTVIGARYT